MATVKTDLIDNSAYSGLPQIENIPSNLRAPGVMSDTSSAPECFINQRLSAKLQAYLIGYVSSVYSTYSVYMP